MDLEDDTHNTKEKSMSLVDVSQVVNVPIMISPEIYNQIADLVIERLENNQAFSNKISTLIEMWMDKNFELSDYDTSEIRDEVLDSVRYDLRNSIRAEVEIFVD